MAISMFPVPSAFRVRSLYQPESSTRRQRQLNRLPKKQISNQVNKQTSLHIRLYKVLESLCYNLDTPSSAFQCHLNSPHTLALSCHTSCEIPCQTLGLLSSHACPLDLGSPAKETVTKKTSSPGFPGTGPIVGSCHALGH